MLLSKFIEKRYDWGQGPALYIVLQEQSLIPPAYRCGAAGTAQHQDADQPYRASESSLKGLNGRILQYHNYFLPNDGQIYAALRIKSQLVALPNQRLAGEDDAPYAVDRANMTAVLAAEAVFHFYLDQKGLRWRKNTRKELFQTSDVRQLIDALRKVQGLELVLFNADDYRVDTAYTGGQRPPAEFYTTETQRRSVITQQQADQTVTVRLSADGIQRLRAGEPRAYQRLMNLMREAFKQDTGTTQSVTIRLRRQDIEALRDDNPERYNRLVDLVKQVARLVDRPVIPTAPKPTRPASPAPSDATTVTVPPALMNALRSDDMAQRAAAVAQVVRATRPITRSQTAPRRSARLALTRAT